MLHILWVIIKFILILLAVIVGIILLLAGLLLFCPLRYKVQVQMADGEYKGYGAVTWLFHIVSFRLIFDNKGSRVIFRIFGIPAEAIRGFFGKIKNLTKKDAKKATRALVEELESSPVNENEEGKKPEKGTLPPKAPPSLEKTEGPSVEDTADKLQENADDFSEEKESLFEKILNRLRTIINRIVEIPEKIRQFFKNIALTIRNIYVKIGAWQEFLEEDRTQEAIRIGWQDMKILFHHIAPRKLSGHLIFGLEDPGSTGKILAVIGATYPIHRNKIAVEPRFDENILEGNVYLRGRVYLAMVLKLAIHLYFDKNIKFVMKSFGQKEES